MVALVNSHVLCGSVPLVARLMERYAARLAQVVLHMYVYRKTAPIGQLTNSQRRSIVSYVLLLCYVLWSNPTCAGTTGGETTRLDPWQRREKYGLAHLHVVLKDRGRGPGFESGGHDVQFEVKEEINRRYLNHYAGPRLLIR